MSILEAAQQTTVLAAALAYVEAGLSVIPVTGKRNSVRWAKFQTERPTPGLVHWWNHKGMLAGVAVVCGTVSGKLVIMDLDGEAAVEQYECSFPHLLDTLTIRSGSGKGKHYYYITRDFMPTTRTPGFELRSDGCYVVAPPSLHSSGNTYTVATACEPKRLDNLEDVRRWILGKIRNQPKSLSIAQGGIVRAHHYAAAALRYECENVRRAGEGSANNALFMAALKMGNFVQANMISRSEVEGALLSAAAELTSRDGESATWKTIQSGITTGIAKGKR